MGKLTIRMKGPFDYGDILKIARAEARKKEHTDANIIVKSILCTKACYDVYYDVQ